MTEEFYLPSPIFRYLNINVSVPKVIFHFHGSKNCIGKVTVYSKLVILILHLMFISEARNVGSVCYICCSLAKLLPSECTSLLFSAVMVFCFAQVEKVEDLSPEVEIPETFYVAEPIWFIFQRMMEYDLLFGCMKAD